MEISERTASEIFCWVGNLEISLENLQTAVVDFFSEESKENRRRMLEYVIGQRQLWGERPTDALQKLIHTKKEEEK